MARLLLHGTGGLHQQPWSSMDVGQAHASAIMDDHVWGRRFHCSDLFVSTQASSGPCFSSCGKMRLGGEVHC